MRSKARLAFHVTALLHHIYVSNYHESIDFSSAKDPAVLVLKNHRHKYFTTWNFILQTWFLLLALIHDIYRHLPNRSESIERLLERSKGYLLTAIVLPSTVFVTCTFWSVYTINREWVFPRAFDNYLPNWVNQSVHTNVLIFVAVELVLSSKDALYVPSFRSSLYGFGFLSLIYQCIFFYTYFQSGRWLYGIFEVLSWPERIIFMFFTFVASVVVLKGGILLQIWITRTTTSEKNTKLK